MKVKIMQVGPIGTNCYLLMEPEQNVMAVIDPVAHGLDMLYSEGSADCAK